jgi:hypothetical protein
MTFFSLYFGVLILFTSATWTLNYVRINDQDNLREPLYNDEIYVGGSKANAVIN